MSWLQRLNETYVACFGQAQFAGTPLTPVDHVEQQAHIEITLASDGAFLRAFVVPKENTLIPATEKSAGRTSGAVAHPLCDKVRYVAADYGSEDHVLYLDQLRRWSEHSGNEKLKAVLRYVERGTVVRDLLNAGILIARPDGKLETVWAGTPSALAKLLTADSKTKERDQGNALIRWRVEIPGEPETAVWKDTEVQEQWAAFNATLPATVGLCFSSGREEPLAFSHPKRLRHGGDGAKLISSNDSPFDSKGKPRQHGYTFAGRFMRAEEAYGLSSAATQRAHNALRWLIARQGTTIGDQVVVAWAVQGEPTPPLTVDTQEMFASYMDNQEKLPEDSEVLAAKPTPEPNQGDAGQAFALRLRKRMLGYRARLGERADIVVIALDSATPGRMAILYYRELRGSEFLDRIERWHSRLAWVQNFGKEQRFVGAPSPRDIAEAAYGRRVDEKLRKATVERLLPCILDGRPLPRDLEQATFHRAVNRAGMEPWEFERVLGIACSLIRGTHPEEDYRMSLDETRTTRDYLYGRLLAVADSIEELALKVANESRETNAARLMQRFADHPATTWRTLELQLRPYIARLRGSRYEGALAIRQKLLDTLISGFPAGEQGSAFLDNHRLSGEFLLGYHSQREELRRKKTTESKEISEGDQQ